MISPERRFRGQITIKNADPIEAAHLISGTATDTGLEIKVVKIDSSTGNILNTTTRVPSLDIAYGMPEGIADLVSEISNREENENIYTTIKRRRIETPIQTRV